MQTVAMKLVTIVAEAALRERLAETVMAAGATGYTVTDATGEGPRGMRAAERAGQNVRVEAVLDADSAGRLVARLAETYFPHYAIVAWTSSVDVVRAPRSAPR